MGNKFLREHHPLWLGMGAIGKSYEVQRWQRWLGEKETRFLQSMILILKAITDHGKSRDYIWDTFLALQDTWVLTSMLHIRYTANNTYTCVFLVHKEFGLWLRINHHYHFLTKNMILTQNLWEPYFLVFRCREWRLPYGLFCHF